eukprot:666490-Amphidinium_carterae.2
MQLTVAGWNEHAPPYWQTVLNRATALHGQYCSTSPAQKAVYETLDQMGLVIHGYNTLVASSNSIEVPLRPCLVEALPQGQKMLKKGIFEVEKMLFESMRQNLPSESFQKIAVIDAVKTRLTEPKAIC